MYMNYTYYLAVVLIILVMLLLEPWALAFYH